MKVSAMPPWRAEARDRVRRARLGSGRGFSGVIGIADTFNDLAAGRSPVTMQSGLSDEVRL
jgi:hypothetical protein